jgi:hypothetical protein
MKRIEFEAAALSLLARNGKMGTLAILDCINQDVQSPDLIDESVRGKEKIHYGRGRAILESMKNDGEITSHVSYDMPPERLAARGGRPELQWEIDKNGTRRRVKISKPKKTGLSWLGGALPVPV